LLGVGHGGEGAVEPVIGHLKTEHRVGRNYLKGRDGDRERRLAAAR
jgi:IS5 family transposase